MMSISFQSVQMNVFLHWLLYDGVLDSELLQLSHYSLLELTVAHSQTKTGGFLNCNIHLDIYVHIYKLKKIYKNVCS